MNEKHCTRTDSQFRFAQRGRMDNQVEVPGASLIGHSHENTVQCFYLAIRGLQIPDFDCA